MSTVWTCLDCSSKECTNQQHAWIQAALVELPDGSEAWLHLPEPETAEPEPPHPWSLP